MDEIRVGDAERSDALDRLGTLFADCYLDVGEFEERTGQAAVARTRGELSMLFDDLLTEPASLEKRTPSEPELDEKLAAKRKMDTAIYTTLIGGLAVFFVLQLGFDLDYAPPPPTPRPSSRWRCTPASSRSPCSSRTWSTA